MRENGEMTCRLVFDAATSGARVFLHVAPGVLFAVMGILLITVGDKFLRANPVFVQWFGWAFFLFSLFWTTVAFIWQGGDYLAARRALSSGSYATAEGRVTDFVPMPYEGHARESFVVDGQRFEYSDYKVTPGFNQTRSHGGPISEGVYVRIAHQDGIILRLEICDPPAGSAPQAGGEAGRSALLSAARSGSTGGR
jgi:hypothetical protein